MTWMIMAVVLVCGALIQTVLPSLVIMGGAKFPVLLAVVLYYALSKSHSVAIVAAFFAGFLQDVLSQIPLGHSVFCFCVAGWVAGYFKNLVLVDSVFMTVVFGGIASMCVTLFFYVLLLQDGLISNSIGWIVLRMGGAVVLGMVCTPLVFLLTGWLDRIVGNVEMEEDLNGVE